MTDLAMGANAPLDGTKHSVLIDLPGGAEIDVTALQIYADGRVRGDGDMCFYGQPVVSNGAMRLTLDGNPRFDVDLGQVPGDVEKIVFTATADGGKTFEQLGDVSMKISAHSLQVPGAGRTEAALILAEIYRRNGAWKIRNVGQGFNGGLAQLATHFGVEIADDGAAAAPPPKPAPSPAVNLSKVTLTKAGERSRISLDKTGDGIVRINATWIDNGDARDDNDDLDLRAGILMPDGAMHWLAASHPGSLEKAPFARHMGDVTQATADAPGTEIIEVAADISQRLGGPVGMVFSVYSAISNGPVSIASLQPEMTIEHAGKEVQCVYKFPDGKAAKAVYTYVIGTIRFVGGDLDVQLSGATSPKSSENTPWIEPEKGDRLKVSFDGPPVFKKGQTFMARMMNTGSKKYANL